MGHYVEVGLAWHERCLRWRSAARAYAVCDRDVGKFEASAIDFVADLVVDGGGMLEIRDRHDDRERYAGVGKLFSGASGGAEGEPPIA